MSQGDKPTEPAESADMCHNHCCGNPVCHKDYCCRSNLDHWTYLVKDADASEAHKKLILKGIYVCSEQCFHAMFGSDDEDEEDILLLEEESVE